MRKIINIILYVLQAVRKVDSFRSFEGRRGNSGTRRKRVLKKKNMSITNEIILRRLGAYVDALATWRTIFENDNNTNKTFFKEEE